MMTSVGRELPSGTVTFLFTDIEGSTMLLHELGEGYAEALAEHRRLLRKAFQAHEGVEVDTQGDAFFCAFPTAPGALAAAREGQEALAQGLIRVRMGLHTGTPLLTEEGYVGADVHRAARIAAAGHGGQVLLSQATRELVEEDVSDLGLHRLKDLEAPQRIFQVGTARFPPLKSLNQANLPVQTTPFVGRERELAEVLALLANGSRLLTLTGPGGSGKTRLALQAAAELLDEYEHGVWWIPLAGLTDPQLVLESAAQVLDTKQELAAHIGDKRMLLVVDNFEQVIEAATDLAQALAGCPHAKLFVTSRGPLRVSGEQVYPVPPLADAESIGFFLGRARAMKPDLEPSEAVAEICHRLDNLPLAIELAAARVAALSVQQILDRLEQRLPLLTGGPRDAPERQRTLRATIEWSHDLLDEDEQRLFARLAVFVGGCTLEAAEEVCEADVDTLQSLVEKSLFRREIERYSMLETIREFAAERLEAGGEADALHRRHLAFFLAASEEAGEHLARPTLTVGLGRLEVEHDNFRAALHWAREAAERELELQFAAALGPFWHVGGHFEEGRRRLVEALSGCPDAPKKLRGVALLNAAWMAHKQGDFEDARARAEEAAACYRAEDDAPGVAASISLLGVVALGAGEYEQARVLLEEAKSLREQLEDELDLASTIHNLGLLASAQGDYEEARRQLEAGLAFNRKHNAEAAIANSLGDLGFVALAQGRQEDARAFFEEALGLCSELGWKEDSQYCLIGLAVVDTASGELERAARLIGAAEAVGEDIQLKLEVYAEGAKVDAKRDLVARLGEDAFARCLEEGRALSLDEAVEYALGDDA